MNPIKKLIDRCESENYTHTCGMCCDCKCEKCRDVVDASTELARLEAIEKAWDALKKWLIQKTESQEIADSVHSNGHIPFANMFKVVQKQMSALSAIPNPVTKTDE